MDAWLLYNLTAGEMHATDHTNASRTALLNLATLDWDPALLDLFEIPRAALPAVQPSSGIFGTCAAIPELAGVPIVAMIGDSHAALVGHGRYAAGNGEGDVWHWLLADDAHAGTCCRGETSGAHRGVVDARLAHTLRSKATSP